MDKDQLITLRLTAEQKDELERAAEVRGLSMSQFIRLVLYEKLDKRRTDSDKLDEVLEILRAMR